MEEWNLGSLTLRNQENHKAVCLVVRLKCKWTPQINYFGTHLLGYMDSLKHKSYIMSLRWHLGLIYVGTKLAINCTCVPIVAPFQTESVYRNRKHGCSRTMPSLCCVNSVTTAGIQDLHSFSTFLCSASNLGHHYQRLTVGWWSQNDLLGEMYSAEDVYLNKSSLNLSLSYSI